MKYFGVLCQGNFCRDNLLFKYKSNLESRLSCCDIIFQDLSKGHFGYFLFILQLRRNNKTDFFSFCVFDLYQFIFTSIDIEVRNRFMADFVCGVYYDSFAKEICQQNKYNLAFLGVITLFHLSLAFVFLTTSFRPWSASTATSACSAWWNSSRSSATKSCTDLCSQQKFTLIWH